MLSKLLTNLKVVTKLDQLLIPLELQEQGDKEQILVIVINSEDSLVLEESRVLFLANKMGSIMPNSVEKRNYENPSVKDMPDMAIFYRILDQAKSSHKI